MEPTYGLPPDWGALTTIVNGQPTNYFYNKRTGAAQQTPPLSYQQAAVMSNNATFYQFLEAKSGDDGSLVSANYAPGWGGGNASIGQSAAGIVASFRDENTLAGLEFQDVEMTDSEGCLDIRGGFPTANISTGQGSAESRTMFVVVDTNVLLSELQTLKLLISEIETRSLDVVIIVPWMVVQELDGLKERGSSRDPTGEVKMVARRVIATLLELLKRNVCYFRGQRAHECDIGFEHDGKLMAKNDDHILMCALHFNRLKGPSERVILVSNDKNLQVKAAIYSLEISSLADILQTARRGDIQTNSRGQLIAPAVDGQKTSVNASHVSVSSTRPMPRTMDVYEPIQLQGKSCRDLVEMAVTTAHTYLKYAVEKELVRVYGSGWRDTLDDKPRVYADMATCRDALHLVIALWKRVFVEALGNGVREIINRALQTTENAAKPSWNPKPSAARSAVASLIVANDAFDVEEEDVNFWRECKKPLLAIRNHLILLAAGSIPTDQEKELIPPKARRASAPLVETVETLSKNNPEISGKKQPFQAPNQHTTTSTTTITSPTQNRSQFSISQPQLNQSEESMAMDRDQEDAIGSDPTPTKRRYGEMNGTPTLPPPQQKFTPSQLKQNPPPSSHSSVMSHQTPPNSAASKHEPHHNREISSSPLTNSAGRPGAERKQSVVAEVYSLKLEGDLKELGEGIGRIKDKSVLLKWSKKGLADAAAVAVPVLKLAISKKHATAPSPSNDITGLLHQMAAIRRDLPGSDTGDVINSAKQKCALLASTKEELHPKDTRRGIGSLLVLAGKCQEEGLDDESHTIRESIKRLERCRDIAVLIFNRLEAMDEANKAPITPRTVPSRPPPPPSTESQSKKRRAEEEEEETKNRHDTPEKEGENESRKKRKQGDANAKKETQPQKELVIPSEKETKAASPVVEIDIAVQFDRIRAGMHVNLFDPVALSPPNMLLFVRDLIAQYLQVLPVPGKLSACSRGLVMSLGSTLLAFVNALKAALNLAHLPQDPAYATAIEHTVVALSSVVATYSSPSQTGNPHPDTSVPALERQWAQFLANGSNRQGLNAAVIYFENSLSRLEACLTS